MADLTLLRRHVAAATILAVAVPFPVRAAVLEEVTVTAQKREQALQDVGISVTAFTGDQLRALGVEQSFDVAAFTPGVHISGNLAGQNTQFSIRGVTQNDFNDIIEAPAAVYLDEGYIAIAQAQTFALFDIERVEISKGPQGTLFGRNATGGTVQYVSRKPDFDEASGYVDFTLGRFSGNADAMSYRTEAAYGGPLNDVTAARVAMLYDRQEPYLNNIYPFGSPPGVGAAGGFGGVAAPGPGAGADMGDNDTFAFRGTLDTKPREDMLLRFAFNRANSEIATGPYQSKSTIPVLDSSGEVINTIDTPPNETRLSIQGGIDGGADIVDGDGLLGLGIGPGFAPPGGAVSGTPIANPASRPVPGGDFFGYLDPDGEDFDTSGDFAFQDQGSVKTWGINGRFEWDLSDRVSLTAVSDFKNYEKLLFIDVDAAPVNQLANYAGVDATSFTQEVRLDGETDRMRWTAGFYYLNIDTTSDNGLKAPANSVIGGFTNAVSGGFIPGVDIGTVATLETDSYNVFGQVEYDLLPSLTAIVGARAIREVKDFEVGIGVFNSTDNFSVNQGAFLPNFFGAGSPYLIEDSFSETLWAGKAQLDWRPNDDLLVYFGVNRGVKAGSFNAPLLGAFLGGGGAPGLPYDEEILVSYEGGFKWSLFGGTTRINASAFYYDYTDYQAFLFVGVGGIVINADAENKGFEFDIQTSPFEGFDALLSFAWQDPTVKNVPLRAFSSLPPRDVKPVYAPDVQATALLRYEWPVFGGMMNVRGDVTYSDEFFYNLRNFDSDKFDSYVMANLGLGWESADGRWSGSIDVRNVNDARAGVQGFNLATLCGCNETSFQPPRWYGVNVTYRF